jgi:hypothetical protein
VIARRRRDAGADLGLAGSRPISLSSLVDLMEPRPLPIARAVLRSIVKRLFVAYSGSC